MAVGLLGVWSAAPGPAHLIVPVVLFATAAVAGLAFQWLKAPSVAGRKTMDEIEGFRLYLGTAEEDRLNAMQSPEKTPELFERFLPYAVALDVQNVWAKRFAGVLAAAGATAAATAWYVGSRDWGNDPVSFADHLGGSLTHDLVGFDGAGIEQWRRRQQRRRLVRRRRRRWRRIGLVSLARA